MKFPCDNKSHEKENKHIHALAANLLHIRVGNLDLCKYRYCKNKVRKIDWLKSQSAREPSHQPAFIGNCLTIAYVSLIYLVEQFFFQFLVQLKKMRTPNKSKVLSFCFWYYGMRKGGESKISFYYLGFESLFCLRLMKIQVMGV